MQNNHLETTTTIRKALLTINITLAILWMYQGLLPKIIHQVIEEQQFWQYSGISFLPVQTLITLSGMIEIIFGFLFLIFRQSKVLHYLNISGMFFFCTVVAIIYP